MTDNRNHQQFEANDDDSSKFLKNIEVSASNICREHSVGMLLLILKNSELERCAEKGRCAFSGPQNYKIKRNQPV